jgi:hypothetical protein
MPYFANIWIKVCSEDDLKVIQAQLLLNQFRPGSWGSGGVRKRCLLGLEQVELRGK